MGALAVHGGAGGAAVWWWCRGRAESPVHPLPHLPHIRRSTAAEALLYRHEPFGEPLNALHAARATSALRARPTAPLSRAPPLALRRDWVRRARRMRDHCWTQGGQLRFYCGAPLIAANNHRIGTLCAPARACPALGSSCNLCVNLASAATRAACGLRRRHSAEPRLECAGVQVLSRRPLCLPPHRAEPAHGQPAGASQTTSRASSTQNAQQR